MNEVNTNSQLSLKTVPKIDLFGTQAKDLTPAEIKNAITGFELRYRIEAVVAGITEKKLKHIYRGEGAATGREVMILPSIPQTKLFTVEHANIILGYTMHETCHQLHTDFGIIDGIFSGTKKPTFRQNQLKSFWNAIEDYRIEKLGKVRYPGFHKYITATRHFSAKRFVERFDGGEICMDAMKNPYAIGALALTWVGAKLNKYPSNMPGEALSRLTNDLQEWAKSWGPKIAQVVTNVEAYDLAVEILDDLDQQRQEQQDGQDQQCDDADDNQDRRNQSNQKGKSKSQKPDQEDGEESEDSGSPDKSSNGKSSQSAKDGNPEEGSEVQDNDGDGKNEGSSENADSDKKSDAGSDTEEEADAEDNSDGNDSSDINSTKDSDSSKPKVKVKDGDQDVDAEDSDLEIDEVSDQLLKQTTYNDRVDAEVVEDVSCGQNVQIERGQKRYTQIRSQVGSAASKSAGTMRRLLMARNITKTKRELDEGSLDLSRLVPIANGVSNIYKRISHTADINTAVSILVDNSGSMSGEPITVCQQASVVLDMAVQGAKADLEINGFTGCIDKPWIYRYRKFGQKGRAASASLGNMDNVNLSGTPVSQAMLDAWKRLRDHKAPRKIMIIITDGDAEDQSRAREVHDIIVRMGGICIGIGIGNVVSLGKWCDNNFQVNDIEDLPIALSRIVQQAMTPVRRAA